MGADISKNDTNISKTKQKKPKKKNKRVKREDDTSNYGTYYGNGLYGPNKETKKNDWKNETPLWCILLAFLCITIQ